jgi:hypothetical protein
LGIAREAGGENVFPASSLYATTAVFSERVLFAPPVNHDAKSSAVGVFSMPGMPCQVRLERGSDPGRLRESAFTEKTGATKSAANSRQDVLS